jgi:hypothetical protein
MGEEKLANGRIATAERVNVEKLTLSVEETTEGKRVIRILRPPSDPMLEAETVGKPVVIDEDETVNVDVSMPLSMSLNSRGGIQPSIGDIEVDRYEETEE